MRDPTHQVNPDYIITRAIRIAVAPAEIEQEAQRNHIGYYGRRSKWVRRVLLPYAPDYVLDSTVTPNQLFNNMIPNNIR